jgi:hypothetical protein
MLAKLLARIDIFVRLNKYDHVHEIGFRAIKLMCLYLLNKMFAFNKYERE